MVSRLCAPIDGTDPARLAHCLGLDASHFHKQVQSSAAQAREEIQLTGTACCDDEDRYKVSLLGGSAAAGVCRVCSAALLACLCLCCRRAFATMSAGCSSASDTSM